MADESNRIYYVAVLTGRMNPAIHHPLWYHFHKLISEDELRDSISNGQLQIVSTPISALSQFSVPAFKIICQQERWEIHTTTDLARTITITKAVFDTLLPHTPTTAIGLNVNATRDIPGASIAVARAIGSCSLNFGVSDPTSATVGLSFQVGESRETVRIATTPENPTVTISTNIHRVRTPGEAYEQFDIGPLFDELVLRAQPALDRANDIFSQLCDSQHV